MQQQLKQQVPEDWKDEPFEFSISIYPANPKSESKRRLLNAETTRGKFLEELNFLNSEKSFWIFKKAVFGLDKSVKASGHSHTIGERFIIEIDGKPLKQPLKPAPKIKPAKKVRKGVSHG